MDGGSKSKNEKNGDDGQKHAESREKGEPSQIEHEQTPMKDKHKEDKHKVIQVLYITTMFIEFTLFYNLI
jgi:hypothetical protein